MPLRLLVQLAIRARSRAADNAGSSIAAKIAMMAITTRSSIRVKLMSFIPGTRNETYFSLRFIKSSFLLLLVFAAYL